jgi:ribosome-associated protein
MEEDIRTRRRIVSKSQRKREVEALAGYGQGTGRPVERTTEKIDLPDALRSAVLEAQRITATAPSRRQMQYIGKIMRSVDAEAIAEQLAEIRGESTAAKAEFHALERWRERLIADDSAVTDWLVRHPGGDAQQLRQLIRNARKEAELGKPPKSSRELFRMLREALAAGDDRSA